MGATGWECLESVVALNFFLLLCPDAVFPHQPGHALLAVVQLSVFELGMNPGAAVGLSIFLVDGLNLDQQAAVLAHSPTLTDAPAIA